MTLADALNAAKQFLRPPPRMLPTEWAEKNVKIPIGNAIPGNIRFDNAPYQREVIDMAVNPDCKRITLMWGAQVGKTQAALCVQAYHIVMRPMSQMMMQPSEGDLQVWLNSKFDPLCEANLSLSRAIAKPRARKGVNNSKMKSYTGGFLMFAWAGSPKTMRGRSAPIIVADEVDGYQVTKEGHPVSLVWQRAATFGDNSKLIEISTPTVKDASYIESAFLAGDQRRFYVACPHCEAEQTLKWDNVQWQGKQNPEDEQYPDTAWYTCIQCYKPWSDGQRKAAIRKGKWIAEKPFKGHASYHLNELYSIFRHLKDIVQSYLDKLATNDLQTFINVSLAETFEETGDKADPDALIARLEEYLAPVPMGGVILTAGVDMQPDRLECEVVAWGEGEESWSIEHRVFWGDPNISDPWDELEDFLSQTWEHEDGSFMTIQSTCVDTGGTGGNTQAAYDWLRGKTGRRIFGIKGVGGFGRPVVSNPSRKQSGKIKRKIDLYLIGVDEAKLVIMRNLAVTAKGARYCHFPVGRDPEYFQQLTAEKLVTKRNKKGFSTREWHQTRPRNEALDCRVYAYAALKISTPSLKKGSRHLRRRHYPTPEPIPTAQIMPPPSSAKTSEEKPPVKPHTVRRSSKIKRNWVRDGHYTGRF